MSTYDTHLKGDDPATTKLYGERTAKNNCQYLLPYIKPDSYILDVGCGPGTITSDFAKIASEGKVIGLDHSAGIVESASTSFPPSTYPNLSFTTGDAYKLDFPDSTFDILHAHQVLVHLTDPVSVLKEFARVVKPGGLVAVRDNSPGTVISLKPEIPAIRSYWAFACILMPKMGMNVDAGKKLPEWAKEAGFVAEDGWKVEYSTSNTLNPTHTPRVSGDAAKMAIQAGMTTEEVMEGWRKGWEEWDNAEGAEFVFEAGELLIWKPVA